MEKPAQHPREDKSEGGGGESKLPVRSATSFSVNDILRQAKKKDRPFEH